jgi:hypothetical protein
MLLETKINKKKLYIDYWRLCTGNAWKAKEATVYDACLEKALH